MKFFKRRNYESLNKSLNVKRNDIIIIITNNYYISAIKHFLIRAVITIQRTIKET